MCMDYARYKNNKKSMQGKRVHHMHSSLHEGANYRTHSIVDHLFTALDYENAKSTVAQLSSDSEDIVSTEGIYYYYLLLLLL